MLVPLKQDTNIMRCLCANRDPTVNMVEDNSRLRNFSLSAWEVGFAIYDFRTVCRFLFFLFSKGKQLGEWVLYQDWLEHINYLNLSCKRKMFLYDPLDLCGPEVFLSTSLCLIPPY